MQIGPAVTGGAFCLLAVIAARDPIKNAGYWRTTIFALVGTRS